ncbi:hypothetical protein [Streptosporangium sp. NPDC000509]|uniref:hypothetical protein n=1 Tax=Streptosporangium sp. NPDC000509 TaxID=3366186 RepID=UPI0036A1A43E
MRVSKTVLAALAAGLVAGAVVVPVHAAGASAGAVVAGAGAVVSAYDGESVYRGLILGIGPVAERFPEIMRPAGGVTAKQEAFASAMVAAISKKDPAFLASFGRETTSGDRVRIDRALTTARNLTKDVLTERFGVKAEATAADRANGLVTYQIAPMAGYVYEVVTVNQVVNVYKVLNMVREFGDTAGQEGNALVLDPDMARLQHERFVDLVAARLTA